MIKIISLVRPLNVVLGGLSIEIMRSKIDTPVHGITLLYLYLVVLLFIAGSNILNDIFDQKSDSVNHPHRAIPSGAISKNGAIVFCLILFSAGIYSAFQLNPNSQWISLCIVLPLIIVYTQFLKSIPLIGNMVIGLMLGFVFIYTETVLTQNIRYSIIPSILAFSLTFIREIVKDIQDIEGDKKVNIGTFPVKFGISNSIAFIKVQMVILCFIVILPFVLNFYGIWYLIAVIFGVIFPIVFSIFFLQKHPTSMGCQRISGVLKFSTVCGLISIYFTNY